MSTTTTHTCDAPDCDAAKSDDDMKRSWFEATISSDGPNHVYERVDGCSRSHLLDAIAARLSVSWREEAPPPPPARDRARA